jgi:sortase B
MVDQQTILYGHHLKNGTMFQPLFLLKDQETFDNTPTVWYLTEGASYELEPLFVYFTDPNDTTVRQFSFSSDEEFRSYLTERLAKAVSRRADAEQIIQGTSHVLTLSTCNYYEGYGRSILVCVPKSEASAATAASN